MLVPGAYDAQIWFASDRPPNGDAIVDTADGAVLARVAGPVTNPARVSFNLPVAMRVRVGVSTPEAAAAAGRVEIIPRDLMPRRERVDLDALGVETVGDFPGGYILYEDHNTFPEGGVYWTNGTRSGRVLVVPGGASMLRLVLHVGPNAGTVRVSVDGRQTDVPMSANETRTVGFPLAPGRRSVPVTVEAPSAFRPSEADPQSTDGRRLGCQVRILLS